MTYEIRVLRAALALAEHRSFSRGSKAIHLSQPALSRCIQQLERSVGTQLFERGIEGIVPTDAGQIFLEHAKDVVAREADLGREMDLLKGLDTGELHIGSGTYATSMMVSRAAAQMVREHPKVRLRIQNENWMNLLPLVRKRELDFAVIGLIALNDPELHIIPLQQHQAYFVVRRGHPLHVSKKEPSLRQVLQFPVVMTSRISPTLLKSFLAGASGSEADSTAKSFPAIACESVGMMKTIATQSDAVAILALNMVIGEIQKGQLVLLPLVVPQTRVAFGVVRPVHRKLSPLGEKFVSLVQEADVELLSFEQKNADKLLAASKRLKQI